MKHVTPFEKWYKLVEDREPEIYGYHAARTHLADEIKTKGLITPYSYRTGGKPMPTNVVGTREGVVYFWLDKESAIWFAKYRSKRQPREHYHVWEVDLTGLDLDDDPEAADMSQWSVEFPKGQKGSAVYAIENIPPERVKRIIFTN